MGIIGILAWFLPIVGLPVTIVGLVLGLKALDSGRRGMATAAIVLTILGLTLTVVNAGIGAYMAVKGEHALVNQIMKPGEEPAAP